MTSFRRTCLAAAAALLLGAPTAWADLPGWPQRMGGTGDDTGAAIAIDDGGNVYSTGSFTGTVTFTIFGGSTQTLTAEGPTDVFVAKQDNVGNWLWVAKGGGPGTDRGMGIAVDKDRNVYVTGRVQHPAAFGSDTLTFGGATFTLFVAKLDIFGTWRWATEPTTANMDSWGNGIAIAHNGEPVVTGAFHSRIVLGTADLQTVATYANAGNGHATDSDMFVARLTVGGDWKWAMRGGGNPGNSQPFGTAGTAIEYNPPNCLYNFSADSRTGNCSPDQPAGGGCSLNSSNPTPPGYEYWCCKAWGGCGQTYCDWWGFSCYTTDENYCQNTAYGGREAAAVSLYNRSVCLAQTVNDAHSLDEGYAVRVAVGPGPDGLDNTPDDEDHIAVAGKFTGSFLFDNVPAKLAPSPKQEDLFMVKITDRGATRTTNWVLDSATNGACATVVGPNCTSWAPGRDASGDHIAALGLAIDPNSRSNIFLTGWYRGSPMLGSVALTDVAAATGVFVGKVSDNGTSANWLARTTAVSPTTGTFAGWAKAFSIDADTSTGFDQGVYITGEFRNRLTVGTTTVRNAAFRDCVVDTVPCPAGMTANGASDSNDVFVAKLRAADLTWDWGKNGGGLLDDSGRGIVADPSGTTFVVGQFRGVARFVEKTVPFTYTTSTQGRFDVDELEYGASMWFKTTCGNCGIFSAVTGPNGSGGHDRHIHLVNGNLRIRLWSNEIRETSGTNYADGNWHHVAHTYGSLVSAGQQVFIDGALVLSGPKSSSNFTWQTDIVIGGSVDAQTPAIDGTIQDVRVFRSHLTAAQVTALFAVKPSDEDSPYLTSTSGTTTDFFSASVSPDAPGSWRSFETWIIGQEVPRPAGVPALNPEIRIGEVDGTSAFHWNERDKKLYAVKDVAALIKWKRSAIPTDFRFVLSFGASIWPDNPQMHVAGAPVDLELPTELQPLPATFTYAKMLYSQLGATDNDKKFVANNSVTGSEYTVLLYTNGTSPDTTQFSSVLEVVRTVPWNWSGFPATPRLCEIGTEITDLGHADQSLRNGWVVFPNSRYDGFGQDAAYNRAERTGPILPVNTSPTDDMVVVWYEQSRLTTVPWGARPLRYNCLWPQFPDKIVVASELGSDLTGQPGLDPATFVNKRIYNQPDRTKPGFNPNEEHAAFFPSNAGTGFDGLFALRSDLGKPGLPYASEPYVLLKYADAATGRWRMKPYKVLDTEAPYTGFNYPGTAGTMVFAPYPVRLLANCAGTTGSGTPLFKDHKNQVWARSKGVFIARYFYPLQPGSYYDPDNDGNQNAAVGDCVPWLDRAPGQTIGVPIAVNYNICWPDEPCAVERKAVPLLLVGETLVEPKRGLPDITNQAAVSIVFDELNPNQRVKGTPSAGNPDPKKSLAQIISPFEEIFVSIAPELDDLPGDIKTDSVQGRKVFKDLPFHLRVRLWYDPLNKRLGIKGHFDKREAGDPLVLLNVLTARELVVAKTITNNGTFEAKLDKLYHLARNPRGLRLDTDLNPSNGITRNPTADQKLWIGLTDQLNDAGNPVAGGDGVPENVSLLGVPGALTAGAATGVGYMTLAFNNDTALGAAPVSLNVIKIGCSTLPIVSPYQGVVKVIESDNVFDEKLTLRHVGDFGGNPDALNFQWFTAPIGTGGTSGTPPPPPTNSVDLITGIGLNGWSLYNPGGVDPNGEVDITIEGANIKTLSDNWWLVRYKGYKDTANVAVCNNKDFYSVYSGQPGSLPTDPLAQLAEGWIKRVEKGLNPFDARVKDFHKSATNTYASMIQQLGERYEGDVALNSDPNNLNQLGLIQLYQTVLNRGKSLSISGTPPVNYGPANQALLFAANRIADFYMLLGNEAYGDAQDPTVSFGTRSEEYGNLAPTIFTFQNQLDSLLDEELNLLRGRDNSGGTTNANPVYNRLFWNFTRGEGEVAYKVSYNITDIDTSGVIDEFDARKMFPQGHGDSWGHFLTASTTYYDLLRHPYFTWENRSEPVRVAGVTVDVDFLDERKFARAAAAKAKAASEIVNLTYRANYVEDPVGQWQGYKDQDTDRAWGVTEWARRAGQAAYFDWVVATSILPSVDPNPNHDGITKIDRTTVTELQDIVSEFHSVEGKMDQADYGLNPLGLAKGVVPFDIDPAQVSGVDGGFGGRTHFEQIHARALLALSNAVTTFDYANSLSRMLRQNQDSLVDFTRNLTDTEIDFKNRLIEFFGYPYPDDIGGAGTYDTGYQGADLYHYMIVDESELTGDAAPGPTQTITGYFTPLPGGGFTFDDTQTGAGGNQIKTVTYSVKMKDTFAITKPPTWTGQRRAQGEIQRKLASILQERARYQQVLTDYDNHVKSITDEIALLKVQYDVNASEISISQGQINYTTGMNIAMGVMFGVSTALHRTSSIIQGIADGAQEVIPKAVGLATDAGAPARGAIKTAGYLAAFLPDVIGDALDISINSMELAKEVNSLKTDLQLTTNSQIPEVRAKIKQIEQLVREEASIRLECFLQRDVLKQASQDYLSTLAEGQRIFDDLIRVRTLAAGDVQEYRYEDMAFRIFRNDALQKYRAQFDVAARYAYLTATAYDYETNLLGTHTGSGRQFLTDIVRHRSLGQIIDGVPISGSKGIADPLARLGQNYEVLEGQLGFNNPQTETNRFSLRGELFREHDESTASLTDPTDTAWRNNLEKYRVTDLWKLPEFRKFCRPFADEASGPQPGLVIPFQTTVTFGLNYFGWPLSGGDSAYDPTSFATRVRAAGVWFQKYNATGLSNTPRVYLVPAGADVLRAPYGDAFATREWRVIDQVLPVPFPLGDSDLQNPSFIPINESLSGPMGGIRRLSSFRAYHIDDENNPVTLTELTKESRLIGRSVWNTKWLLIIPGGTLLFDPNEGLDLFIHGKLLPDGTRDGDGVQDISILFNTYAYSGN